MLLYIYKLYLLFISFLKFAFYPVPSFFIFLEVNECFIVYTEFFNPMTKPGSQPTSPNNAQVNSFVGARAQNEQYQFHFHLFLILFIILSILFIFPPNNGFENE